jgi:hypothetical protein
VQFLIKARAMENVQNCDSGLTTLTPSMGRLSSQCGSLDISQPYRPPRPVMGTANFSSYSQSLQHKSEYFSLLLILILGSMLKLFFCALTGHATNDFRLCLALRANFLFPPFWSILVSCCWGIWRGNQSWRLWLADALQSALNLTYVPLNAFL